MRRKRQIDLPEIQIAPMIDCVFLMLVYFMTTSSLERSEADLACPIGGSGGISDPLAAIDEQHLSLDGEGTVLWNGSRFLLLGSGEGAEALRERLEGFRRTVQLAGSEASLMLAPEAGAPHQALVTLLDAISISGIESVQFP